jgi:hypothetical protein
MEYQAAVAEARQLVKRSEQDQWRLAELTWEQVDAGRSIGQWATDIGVSRRTVSGWRAIWTRWGMQPLHSRPPWSEAYQQVNPSGATPDSVDRAVRNMPPEQKAEVVREALAEPEVAERVVRDTPTRVHLAKAEHKADREQQETARERYELAEPRSVQIGARADLGYALTKARTALEDAREAADKLAAYGWPDNSRDEAQVLGQRVHAALELYWATVRGEKLDEELRALVEGGDA